MVFEIIVLVTLISILLILTALCLILAKRSIPLYAPNAAKKHGEKPPEAPLQNRPDVSTIMVSKQRKKPKFFTDDEIWDKLHESRRNDSGGYSD